MKNITAFLLMMICQIAVSQKGDNVSVFHRLLTYNENNEVMIVKFKDTDIWVTPGFYQDNIQYIRDGLHKVASTYGITITDPELKGVFSMRREFTEYTEMKIRNIYKATYKDGELKMPESIGEVKWVTVEEALKTITYKSINLFLKQTYTYPDIVWGGSVHVVRKGTISEYQIIEEFYPLFEINKK